MGKNKLWDRVHPEIPASAASALAYAQSNKLTNLITVVQRGKLAPTRCVWHLGTLIGATTDDRAALAWLIAEAVMVSRGGGSRGTDLWRDAALAGRKLIGADRVFAAAFIDSVFGLPPKGKSPVHVRGHVAEWLWYLHARESVLTSRSIELLEAPKFNVTEPGGDGFIVFSDDATGEMSFRLWEIKQHVGKSPVSATVSGAYGQLVENAPRYLAQLTSIHSTRKDLVGELCKQLVDLWIDCNDRAGTGVGVTSATTPPPTNCFTTMGKQFPGFNQPGQLEGLLLAIEDLDELAIDVRGYLWTVL